MKRTNEFVVVPQSDEDEELIRRLLDASAALWNEINYERRRSPTPIPTETSGKSVSTEVATAAFSVRRRSNRSNARTAKRGGRSSRSKTRTKPTASPDSGATKPMDASFGRTFATRRTPSSGATTPDSKFSSAKI